MATRRFPPPWSIEQLDSGSRYAVNGLTAGMAMISCVLSEVAARRRGGNRGPDAPFLISTAPSVSCQINARQSDQKWLIPWDVVEMVRVVATRRGN